LDGSFVLVFLFILLSFSPLFGLFTLGIGLTQILILVCTNRPLLEISRRELIAEAKAQSYITEAVAGMSTLKATGAEPRAMDEWSNLFLEQMNCSVRRNYLSSVINAVMTTLRTITPLALLWLGTWLVLDKKMSIGDMLALHALAIAFLTPLASLVTSGQQLQ